MKCKSMNYISTMDMESHPLLEPRAPAYTHATVRRAFIVWLRCGQKNEFRDVCNYYHRLEALEAEFSAESRESSRQHEFSLFSSNPPTSPYQQSLFPQLYSSPHRNNQVYNPSQIQNYHIAEPFEDLNQHAMKVEGIPSPGVTLQEIFEASQVFKAYEVNEKIAAKFDKHVLKRRVIKKQAQTFQEWDDIMSQSSQKYETLKGTSKQEILETSRMIKNHCKEQEIPLKTFLENFKEYAKRCEMNNTVNNVGVYIKKKMVHAELALELIVHKAKNNKEGTKLSAIIRTNTNEDNKRQDQERLLAPFSKLNENDINDNTKADFDIKKENLNNNMMICYKPNEDLIKFDKNDSIVPINEHILFQKEDGLKTNADFLTS